MEVQSDFKDLLELLNTHEVEYLIVGGYALAFHGAPRFTGDLDILIHATEKNAQRVLDAIEAFGFSTNEFAVEDFTKPDQAIQLGVPPVRIDFLTSIVGVSWEEALAQREDGSYGGVPVRFIGRHDFIRNKRALGRHKDLADIEALGEK